MSEQLKTEVFMEGVRENGTVEGHHVETYFCPLQQVLEDERGFYRFVADGGATDVEIRIRFTDLERWGWTRPCTGTSSECGADNASD